MVEARAGRPLDTQTGSSASSSSSLSSSEQIYRIVAFHERNPRQVLGMPSWDKVSSMLSIDSAQPNRFRYLALLNACTRIKDAKTGQELHAEIVQRGLEEDVSMGSAQIGNKLIDMYGKCGLIADAQSVFQQLPVRDCVSWNALISGYAKHGLCKEADRSFELMQHQGISPDPFTYSCSLKTCIIKETLWRGQEMHSEISRRGWERNIYVCSALLVMYMKCASLKEAQKVFDCMQVRDVVSWATLIAGYTEHGFWEESWYHFQQMLLDGIPPDSVTYLCILKACGTSGAVERGKIIHAEAVKRGLEGELYLGSALIDMYTKCGMLAEASRVLEKLPFRNAVAWNALIAGYAEHGLHEEVLHSFNKMQLEGISADAVTLLLCLKACAATGALEIGREIHAVTRHAGLEGDVYIGSGLVDMYGKCASISEGKEVFDKLTARDVVSWNTMIKAYGDNQQCSMALQCFEDMLNQRLRPDSITFTCLLAACSNASSVLKGQAYFKMMKEEYGIEPTADHVACMVDLFARSGHVHEADKFLAAIQSAPSKEVLMALLSACKMHGKVELGQRCFQQLVELAELDAAAYLLMIDLYTAVGHWIDADNIEEMRAYAGANKKPASTSIEVNKTVHGFVVGMKRNEEIVELLASLRLSMNVLGHVPH